MTHDADLLRRMRTHPIGRRYADLARVLQRAGLALVGGKGSHRRWRHESGVGVTLVDGPGDIKAASVRDTCRAIEQSREVR